VPGAPGTAAADEVRTIFITGLPLDVKERELHNLLRWLPGFEASQVNFKGDQPMGFALFATAHQAVAAKAALQDLVFDAETKSALHTEASPPLLPVLPPAHHHHKHRVVHTTCHCRAELSL